MKIATTVSSLLILVGSASAGWNKPELTINLKDGIYANVAETVAAKVSITGKEGENIEYGAFCLASLPGRPGSLWASLRSKIGDRGVSLLSNIQASKGQYDFDELGDRNGLYGTFELNDADNDVYGWASAAIGSHGNFSPLKVGLKKIIQQSSNDNKGKVMISPRYNFKTEETNLVLGYEQEDTQAYLTLSKDDQDLYIDHQINDHTSATGKIGKTGFLSASVIHKSKDSTATTTVTCTPDTLDLEIKNDGWVVGINAFGVPAIRGGKEDDLKVRLSKTATFSFI